MILANAIHFYTYYTQIPNALPFAITAILGFFALIFFIAAMEEPTSFLVFLFVGACLFFPIKFMDFHHAELRHGVEMQVQVNNDKVWIPARQLPNGVYWPDGFASLTKHKDANAK